MDEQAAKRLIDAETEASEQNPDAPLPEGAPLSRPNRARSTLFSIRLNADEATDLLSIADTTGLPPSTLARSWIVDRIQAERGDLSDMEAELHAAQRHLTHLQQHLRREAS